jgi:hypothetical protein
MKYYKVKPEYDQRRKPGKKYDIYIENELYTPAELRRQELNPAYMDIVEIPKNRTYHFFGARQALQ